MKRLISLTAAIALIISIIAIPVSASDTMTSKEYRTAQSYLIDKYSNNEITFTEFQEQSQAITNEYITQNTIDGVVAESALTVGNTMTALTNKMANLVSQYGDDACIYVKDWWNDICNKNNVPTETTQTSTSDLMGAGAKITQLNDGYGYAYTCDYVIIRNNGSYSAIGSNNKMYYVNNGKYSYASAVGSFGADIDDSLKFYGDVRYEDGTPAPSDDNYVYGTIKKFDNMTDKQINDLLNDFAEEMERQNPDLSTVEGLLNAIYARLSKLDSDDDGAMLSAINAAIISLASDNNASNAEIIALLQELRDKETEGADLDPILNELKEVNKSLDYLKKINTLDLIGDSIETLLGLTESEQAFLNEYANIILSLTAKLGYAPVTAMISNIEAIMLNGNPPQDIVTTIYDTQVVLLSSSVFNNSEIASALSLAKLFASVLLAISWLYAMRKKITGGA